MGGVVVVAKVGQQLTAFVRLQQRLEVPPGQVAGQTDPVVGGGGHLIEDLRTPGHGGAGGEQGDHLLGAQRLVTVQVVLLKQGGEELQTRLGQLHRGPLTRGHTWHHLVPGQAKVVTVAEPDNNIILIILNDIQCPHFLSIVHVVSWRPL